MLLISALSRPQLDPNCVQYMKIFLLTCVLALCLLAVVILVSLLVAPASNPTHETIERGMEQLWERRNLAEQLAQHCSASFLRARLAHLKHPHNDMRVRTELFAGDKPKAGLFGTLAFASTLFALSGTASKVISPEAGSSITWSASVIFAAFVVVVLDAQMVAVSRSGLETGFIIIEEAIEIREELESKLK